ncbi:hypothetical protein BaRGS_00015720, partial [Batillaria attramentaria]
VAPAPHPQPPAPSTDHLYPSASNGPSIQDTGDPDTNAAALEQNAKAGGTENSEERTLFFNDGVRRIDYVLAYKQETDSDEKKKTRREVFEANLQKAGLALERETVEYEKSDKMVYVKIHAPWSVLTAQAEIMNMKMPLAPNDMMTEAESCWTKCPTPFDYDESILPPLPEYFTAAFSREREDQFVIEDRDTFFSTAQRSLLVYQLLQRCVFEDHGDKTKNKFGIKKMLSSGCYDAAYPLHEGEYASEHSILTRGKQNNRHLLYETWARPIRWYKFQPLDHIRMYFGEKVGIYFAWLGYYTSQLIPAAIVGLVAFIYGLATFLDDANSINICDKSGAGGYVMCPLCDGRCSYWFLERSCIYSRVTYLFDNPATVAFAGFMALWATVFAEMWKRRTAEIEYDWDVADYEEEETVRPEYEASVKKRRVNPINKLEEPYLSFASRACRYLSSLWVILFMLIVVLAAVFGVIVYRMTVSALLFAVNQEQVSKWSSTITSITAACINLVCIILLGKFVNHYGSLIYIAFFKGKFIGRPGDYNREINDKRQEECDPAGCLIELLIQLGIIMVGKQAINNAKEFLLPKVMNWFKGRRVKEEEEKASKPLARWEKDYSMACMPDLGLFEEYLEMVLQYGFVTLFVAAFPLAPFFALLNNVIEIRLDAYKFVTQWRRPLAERAQDIGIWFGILRGISTVAVASNACIIAFTSEFIPKLVYRYGYNNTNMDGYIDFSLSRFDVQDFETKSIPRNNTLDNNVVTECRYRDFREPPGSPREYQFTMEYWHVLTARLAFIISFILVIVFLQWLISFLVPDIPRFVKMMMLREKYLAKEAILASEALRPDNLDGGTSSRNVNGSGNVLTHRKSPAAQRPGAGSFPSEQPLY